ncbi:MAG: tetratricopeptide repeat protein, partial [Holophagaceae bacterium]
ARAQKEKLFLPTARKILKVATQEVPQEIELWGRSAELSESQKDSEEALEAWSNVVALREDFIPAWERILVLSQQLNRYESRRQATLYLVTRVGDKRSLSALESLANEQVKKNYTMHAEESYLLLSQALATEADSWEVLGLIQLQLKKYTQALKSLESALALRPSHRIRFSTAQVQMLLGRNEEAHEFLRTLWDEIKEDRQNPLRDKTKTLLVINLFLMKRYNTLLEFSRTDQSKESLDPILSLHVFMTSVAKEDWLAARMQFSTLLNLPVSELGLNFKELLGTSLNPL